jgi:cardiolipin synthase
MSGTGHVPEVGPTAPDVRRQLSELAGTPPSEWNAVTLLSDGADSFGAILDLVRRAERRIQFENFIFRADSVGRAFAAELRRRAADGVHVQVVHDPVGAIMARRPPVDLLFRASPVQVAMFNLGLGRRGVPSPGRDHRKLVVVDGRAFVAGGICLADPWAGNCVRHCTWRDSAVLVEGPAAQAASTAFDEAWGWSRSLLAARGYPPVQDAPRRAEPSGLVPVRVLADLGRRRPTRAALQRAIDASEREVLMTTPYFVPPADLRDSLRRALSRGVEVSLLLPRRNNHPIVGLSAEHGLGEFLDEGARVFLWSGAMLHAKSVVIDAAWTLIGSSNLDALSLDRNAELNIEIHGRAVGEAMARLFLEDCASSTPLTVDAWRQRPRFRRLAARAAWSLRAWQ